MKEKLFTPVIAIVSCLLFYSCSKSTSTSLPGWSHLGTSTGALNANNSIWQLAADAKGNIYAAGLFTNSTGNYYVAKWDGNTWSELGAGATALNANGSITRLVFDNSGNLYAAGKFKDPNYLPYVAKWDGTTWNQLTDTIPYDGNLTLDATGNIYACVNFSNPYHHTIAKWNGAHWIDLAPIGSYIQPEQPQNMVADLAGNLYINGSFNAGGLPLSSPFVKCSGGTWTIFTNPPMANGTGVLLRSNKGDILAAYPNLINKVGDIAEWNGANWVSIENGRPPLNANYDILAITEDPYGNIYAAGTFTNDEGYEYVAKWDGADWKELKFNGVGLNFNAAIRTLVSDGAGNIYAAGDFTDNSGHAYVAKFSH